MNKGNKNIISSFGILIAATIILGQGSGYLSQKLMVENDIRDRVKEALSRVIDSHKYVINVDVDLDILDEVNEQITVFAPRESNKQSIQQVSPEERPQKRLLEFKKK